MSLACMSRTTIHRAFGRLALLACAVAPVAAGAAGAPDLLSKKGITLGGAVGGAGGKFVPWGGSVVLSDADAFAKSDGKCAFYATYDLENDGDAAVTKPFSNLLRGHETMKTLNSNLTLGAHESKQINTHAYVQPGSFVLSLTVDSENSVAESNESNNASSIKATLTGTCGAVTPPPVAKPDITSQKGITIGGTTSGAGGKFAPWGSSITVSSADALSKSNGKCTFVVSYDLENIGSAATAAPFSNTLKANDAVASVSNNLTLAAGQTKQVVAPAILPEGEFTLALQIDTGNADAESNESNNLAYLKVNVSGSCAAPQSAKPDLVSQKGITIGGKFVSWGGSVTLGASNASARSKDRCMFSAAYDLTNIGTGAAAGFVNTMYSGSTMVAQQSVPGLGAGETKQATAQLAIAPGTNNLYLLIDSNKSVVETSESNNASYIKTVVESDCLLSSKQPLRK